MSRLGMRLRGSQPVSQWLRGGSLVKSVQRGTIAITGATSNTATITSVDTANTRLRLIGRIYDDGGAGTGTNAQYLVRIALTNATTVTASVNTSPGGSTCTVSFEVVEYVPGVVKSVQRGTVTIGAGTATINAVNVSKAELDHLGLTDNAAALTSGGDTRLTLTNATTVTVAAGVTSAQVTGYQVVEFY